MRLTTALLFLASLATFASANDWANAVNCAKKNPDINTAIDAFCSKGNIVVPSKYARRGKGHNGMHVKVYGKCSPAQWIPPTYCRSQFHAVCAHHEHGRSKKSFGRGGCQHFKIGGKQKSHKPLPNPMGEADMDAFVNQSLHKTKRAPPPTPPKHTKKGNPGGYIGPKPSPKHTKSSPDGYIGP